MTKLKNEIMTDEKAIELVKKTFDLIEEAKTKDELKEIPKKLSLYKFDEKKYPPLEFKFSEEEIKSIKNRFGGSNTNLQESLNGPIAKLLYALIWKQGDLAKLKPIVEGMIEEQELQKKEAAIFRQFGRHLKNRDEPIVDQHVLRAYGVFKNRGDIFKVSSIRKQEKFQFEMIKCYRDWFKKNKLSEAGSGTVQDHILFGLGKTIKASKTKADFNV